MTQIVTIYSAHEGAGKSTIVANLGVTLAAKGKRIGIIDANLESPALHWLFCVPDADIEHTFNHYLLDACEIHQTVLNMSPYVPDQMAGKLFLIPASADPRDASRVLREKYHIKLLTDRLRDFSEQMGLDVLLIDTRSGISDKTLLTMLSIGVCDTMLVVMRLDQREYQGTGVAIDVAQMLEIPRIMLTINQMPAVYDPADVQREVEHAYNRDVAALIPYADEIVSMEMANIFVTHFPNHRAIPAFAQLADMLLRPLELE